TWLVSKVHAVLYLFGAFILWSGIHLLFQKEEEAANPADRPFVVWLSRHLRLRPLFIALIVVEISDLLFAADSIPAVFGITLDPFIVVASNIFAILGLRTLYFLLVYAHATLEGLQTG